MKLYITTDYIGSQSGGGIVTSNELEALKFTCKNYEYVSQLDAKSVSPTKFGLPDTPFLSDYLAIDKISHYNTKIDLAHFYSGTFTQTIRLLHNKDTRVTYTCAAHDRKISINEFERLGYNYPYSHIKDDKLWSIYFGGVKEADVIIAPSKISAEFLKNEGCKKVEIIPHGIYIPDKVEPIPNQFNTGYLGALGPDKGIVYIIKSWSSINYSDSTLILAGRGTEQLGPFINKYATGGKYHLMGYVNNISDFYNNIAIYIQPSVTEGWGIEVGEAMAHGRPVVVSNGAGAADMVTDGIDGFIVNKRDVKDIANKIQYFKDNPREIERMGKNAREKSFKYDWSIIRQKYIDLWESII